MSIELCCVGFMVGALLTIFQFEHDLQGVSYEIVASLSSKKILGESLLKVGPNVINYKLSLVIPNRHLNI